MLRDMNISRAAAHVVHFRSVIYELPFCLRCPYSYRQQQSHWMSFIFNESWWFEATETLSIMYLNVDEQWSDAVTANRDQHFTSLTSVLEVFFHSFSPFSLVTRLKQGYCVLKTYWTIVLWRIAHGMVESKNNGTVWYKTFDLWYQCKINIYFIFLIYYY